MNPYLDADFLLHLLVRTRETARASQLLRRLDGPITHSHTDSLIMLLPCASQRRGARGVQGMSVVLTPITFAAAL